MAMIRIVCIMLFVTMATADVLTTVSLQQKRGKLLVTKEKLDKEISEGKSALTMAEKRSAWLEGKIAAYTEIIEEQTSSTLESK